MDHVVYRPHAARAFGCGVSLATRVAQLSKAAPLVLLGVAATDTQAEAEKLWNKIWALRINEDSAGKTNLALVNAGNAVLIVSQFTLLADCKHGRRPSFSAAGPAEHAEELYRAFCELARADAATVETGVFGAHMQVKLENDGPFTIVLDTDEL